VTGTLAIDTVLFFVVVHRVGRQPLWASLAGAAAFLLVDLTFFAANLTKIPDGGWFPLVAGVGVFIVLMTWRRGREIITAKRVEMEGDLREFVCELNETDTPPARVPGTAIFLNANGTTTPLALRFNVEHNKVRHDHVVIATVETLPVPHVADDERFAVDDLLIPDDDISLVELRFGFQDQPDVPRALRLAQEAGLRIDVDDATWFLSRITIDTQHGPGMAMWRKRLFRTLSRNAADRAAYFGLPADRVVALGGSIRV
jgi:KUP system potassium uptake protein